MTRIPEQKEPGNEIFVVLFIVVSIALLIVALWAKIGLWAYHLFV